jgi:acid phosphatase family membrane protein YuiD
MAEADPKHASGFLTPSVGILGLVHNGWVPSTGRPQTSSNVCLPAWRPAQRHSRGLPRRPFIAAVIAFVIAQTLKAFTFWYSERRWDWTRLIGSGGMPSSHTGCVSAPPFAPRRFAPSCKAAAPVWAGVSPLQHEAVCPSVLLLFALPTRVAILILAMTVLTYELACQLSSHVRCAQVTALTTAIGVLRGTNNEAFAVGLVFSLVVRQPLSVDRPNSQTASSC